MDDLLDSSIDLGLTFTTHSDPSRSRERVCVLCFRNRDERAIFGTEPFNIKPSFSHQPVELSTGNEKFLVGNLSGLHADGARGKMG